RRPPQRQQQRFVLPNELFIYTNVLIRELVRVHRKRPFVFAGFLQILAIERAIERHLALLAAAQRTDLPVHGRAVAPRTRFLADFASHFFSITARGGTTSATLFARCPIYIGPLRR